MKTCGGNPLCFPLKRIHLFSQTFPVAGLQEFHNLMNGTFFNNFPSLGFI
jgi:hypothetical protein